MKIRKERFFMLIEVIVQHPDDARDAEKYGVDRLELVTAIGEGGLTPSYGMMIKSVIDQVNIPVQVMVRPHSRSFIYTQEELNIIKEDINIMKNIGVQGIVFGCLDQHGMIDEQTLQQVLEVTGDMDVTFHRAFDEAKDLVRSYKTLCKYKNQISRVLTSGGQATVKETDPLTTLIELQKELNGPEILVGSGLKQSTFKQIAQKINANEYHFGSGVRVDGSFVEPIDEKKVRSFREVGDLIRRSSGSK
ncbi:copper homeostasis protein CutC [Evansella halocellulosilytica]|uniref:copper homeostasis protein CutC n=1 Tax=Evansella halocellulosilytica TaxID=2011013 RepID=UPI00211CBA02|nr:copper homeostasis protein CutC [Evansella halocellulosilytica]